MQKLLALTGASTMSVDEQKAVKGGRRPGGCTYFPDSCPPGLCCNVATRRCVQPPGGCA